MKYLYSIIRVRLDFSDHNIGMVVASPETCELRLVEGWLEFVPPDLADTAQDFFKGAVHDLNDSVIKTKMLWVLHRSQNDIVRFRYPMPTLADNIDEVFSNLWNHYVRSN